MQDTKDLLAVAILLAVGLTVGLQVAGHLRASPIVLPGPMAFEKGKKYMVQMIIEPREDSNVTVTMQGEPR